MADNPIPDATSNGEYRFDQNTVRLGVGATTLGILLFGSLGIVSGAQEGMTSKGTLFCLVACLVLIAAAIHISRLSGRTLRISDEGIWVLDKRGHEIGNIHWVELGRVTEHRRMAQLALWDKSGTRRVLVDQQFESFALIRSRILVEYAKVFMLSPLPIEFHNPNPLLLEPLVFSIFAGFCAFGAWSTYRQGQIGLSVCLFSFAVVSLGFMLNLYPGIAGKSGLFEDQLILRSLFKTENIYRKDVSGVELQDIANPHGGQKFSFILLNAREGKSLRITSKFGSIPELYLTLQAWLGQSPSGLISNVKETPAAVPGASRKLIVPFLFLIVFSFGFSIAYWVFRPKPVSVIFGGISMVFVFAAIMLPGRTVFDRAQMREVRTGIPVCAAAMSCLFGALAWKFHKTDPALSLAWLTDVGMLCVVALTAFFFVRPSADTSPKSR